MTGESRAPCDISVDLFCHDPATRLGPALASIAAAGRGFRLGVTVIAHGMSEPCLARAKIAIDMAGLPARLYAIAHGDTANAINQAFYTLRQPARLHVFMESGVTIAPDSFSGFAALLSRHKNALAATGGTGRAPSEAGRLHAQLCAFRPAFIDRLTEVGLFMPIGLTRVDTLLAAMACHDLDALQNPWNGQRLKATVEAIYQATRRSPLHPSFLRHRYRQNLERMCGLLEEGALRSIVSTQGFAALPHYADEMIAAWLAGGGAVKMAGTERVFMHLARKRIAAYRRPDPSALEPELLFATA